MPPTPTQTPEDDLARLDALTARTAELIEHIHARIIEGHPAELVQNVRLFNALATGLRRAILLKQFLRKAIAEAARVPAPSHPAALPAAPAPLVARAPPPERAERPEGPERAERPERAEHPERLERLDTVPADPATFIAELAALNRSAEAELAGEPALPRRAPHAAPYRDRAHPPPDRRVPHPNALAPPAFRSG